MLELRIMEDGTAVPLGELCDRVVDRIAAEQLGEIIETLIAALDEAQGDIDLEDGDSDHCAANDDHGGARIGGIVCGPHEDDDVDLAWSEWNGRCPIWSDTFSRQLATEDDEDDDPDSCSDDVGEVGSWPEGVQGVHSIADDDGEEDSADVAARRPFREMIRRTRCIALPRGAPFDGRRGVDYRLRAPNSNCGVGRR